MGVPRHHHYSMFHSSHYFSLESAFPTRLLTHTLSFPKAPEGHTIPSPRLPSRSMPILLHPDTPTLLLPANSIIFNIKPNLYTPNPNSPPFTQSQHPWPHLSHLRPFQCYQGPSEMRFLVPNTQSHLHLLLLPSLTSSTPIGSTPRHSSSVLHQVFFPSSQSLGFPLLGLQSSHPFSCLLSITFKIRFLHASRCPTSQPTAPTFLPYPQDPTPSIPILDPFLLTLLKSHSVFPFPSTAILHPFLNSHACPSPSPPKLTLLPSPTLPPITLRSTPTPPLNPSPTPLYPHPHISHPNHTPTPFLQVYPSPTQPLPHTPPPPPLAAPGCVSGPARGRHLPVPLPGAASGSFSVAAPSSRGAADGGSGSAPRAQS